MNVAPQLDKRIMHKESNSLLVVMYVRRIFRNSQSKQDGVSSHFFYRGEIDERGSSVGTFSLVNQYGG